MYVDDELDLELLITQKFRREIRKNKYEFVFAHNGREALELLNEHPDTAIILSDINMPVMDGLTLLSKIKEINDPALKTIIVSAYGDMENIRIAMNRGAFDFVTKPIDFEDLEITINKTIDQASFIRESLVARDKLFSIEADLNVARSIQHSILPKVFPPFPERKDFDIYASMEAAKSVGGDFYDFFLIDDDHVGFIIGDVCDKGIPAAIFMAVSRTLLRAYGLKGLQADECLYSVNNLLVKESVDNMFVTVFYGIIDTMNGVVTYSNGGHNPPYILRKDGAVEEIMTTRNPVLGIFENNPYSTKSFVLNPGETIYVFTDGVTEAMNEKRELFSEERLISLLEKLTDSDPKTINDSVAAAVSKHSGAADQSDDITMLVLKYFGR